MAQLSFENIKSIIIQVENDLLKGERVKFTFDKKWSSNFIDTAGVYAVFDKNKLVYIGQSANVKERMKEFKRTVNHSFRRKLGKHLFKGAKVTKSHFPSQIEEYLNQYYLDNINISALEVQFGRLEIESNLINKYRDSGLLNSEAKRSAKQYI